MNGSVIYSTTVDFIKYGVQNFSFDINVGALLGQQTLVARVNWADHNNETRTTNNSVSTTFNVKKLIETSTESVAVNGEYVEGFEVISSFYVTNEAASDIIPSDGVTFDFVVYSMNGSSTNVVSQQTWSNVVIPAGGRNLVYFKWRVPAGSAGTTYFCKGTINPGRMANETNGANNTTEYAVLAQSIGSSQTPNTHFESNAPSSYNPSITAPTAKSGSATWNMWVYENGSIVLKQYGVSVTSADPDLLPSSACLTAEKVGNTWKMKSGYGVTISWNPKLVAKSGYTMPSSNAYTAAQSVFATFPEYCLRIQELSFDKYSLNNALLIFAQKPDAVKVKDFDAWKKDDISIKKGAKSFMILEPSPYKGTDGKMHRGYNAKNVFDISDVEAPEEAFSLPKPYEQKKLIAALVHEAPVPVRKAEQSLGEHQAIYDAKNKVTGKNEHYDKKKKEDK